MTSRGPYAKGIAKREDILTAALEVIARNGYRRTSVRELADAVGLSQAGLLHYFSSKEELFQEILRKRDDVDASAFYSEAGFLEGFLGIVRRNVEVPGLVQLFAQLSSAAAGDQGHPSREFFVRRYEESRRTGAEVLRREQDAGRLDPHIDPDVTASLLIAALDGLQTQWMLDPSIDMPKRIAYLWDLITQGPKDSGS